jgi:hypothetical protein
MGKQVTMRCKMNNLREYDVNVDSKFSENSIQEGYNELTESLKRNPSLTKIIDGLLEKLDKEENYPFLLFELNKEIFPNLIGQKGAEFLNYILENGYNDFDLSKETDLQIYILMKKYGVSYSCAVKFLNNQLDFATSQLLGRHDDNKLMLRLIRSDKKSLLLNLDLDSMTSMVSTMINHLAKFKTMTDNKLSDKKVNELLDSIYKLLKEINLEETNEQVDEDVDK